MRRSSVFALALAAIVAATPQTVLAQAKGKPPSAPSAKTTVPKADIAAVLAAIDGLKKDVNGRLDKIEAKVDTLDKKVTTLEGNLAALKSKVDNLPEQAPLPRDFTGWVKRASGSWKSVQMNVPFELDGTWYCYQNHVLYRLVCASPEKWEQQ